nr:hypothetical protein Itr_chr02CG08480 [Ipomoea trifida]
MKSILSFHPVFTDTKNSLMTGKLELLLTAKLDNRETPRAVTIASRDSGKLGSSTTLVSPVKWSSPEKVLWYSDTQTGDFEPQLTK